MMPGIGRNTRPGTGHERDRMRSRTPNENSATHVALVNKLDQKSVNEEGQAMMATTVAASSRQNKGFGTLSVTSSTHRRVKSRINNSNTSFQLDGPTLKPPGPATYEKKAAFPAGPKHYIQRKTKRDSMFETTIA